MKNMFLLIVITVLLVTLGFGQTLAPSNNIDQTTIKGCLGGSDGNFTLTEDGTTQTFKIASSTVDLKPHLGHDIEVTGSKTTATSSGAPDNGVAVTGVSMISEHCATATASANPATASTPAVAETVPSTTTPTPAVAETVPTTTASAPAVTETTPVATTTPPVVADPAPTAAATTPIASTSAPDDTKQLPNTATPLPLLGLLGLGLLGLGLFIRRSRTN
jgi:LPXTG-motif cell wall-anchored protein